MLVTESVDLQIARELLSRGFLTPIRSLADSDFVPDLVIPVLDDVTNLQACLATSSGTHVVVVDDGSQDAEALAAVARASGADIVRHERNLGPAAARNTGMQFTRTPVVAFIDADCVASKNWSAQLLSHFADTRVGAVAPRVRPVPDSGKLLGRFERTRSALDMGARPGLVQPGAQLSFVPSAALLVRRSAVGADAFDKDLRLGEDVDLIWRLTESGWIVRYDPSIEVHHRTRVAFQQWLKRRFEYGTSAADLETRHPGKLTPLRISPWNASALLLLACGHPLIAIGVTVGAVTLLWRQLRDLPAAPALSIRLVAKGVLADGVALGHLLRREWWPVGMLLLAATPRSRTARHASLAILGPIAWEWCTTRTHVDPISYAILRLIEDAAYGSGVIASSVRARKWQPLVPRLARRRRKRA